MPEYHFVPSQRRFPPREIHIIKDNVQIVVIYLDDVESLLGYTSFIKGLMNEEDQHTLLTLCDPVTIRTDKPISLPL